MDVQNTDTNLLNIGRFWATRLGCWTIIGACPRHWRRSVLRHWARYVSRCWRRSVWRA